MEKKRAAKFGDEELRFIVDLWADEKMQQKFKSSPRHNYLWEQIKIQLLKSGFNRSVSEIKNKIVNMKAEYKKMKPTAGSAPPSWPFFSIMHKVLEQRDVYNENLVHDSTKTEINEIHTGEEEIKASENGQHSSEDMEDSVETIDVFLDMHHSPPKMICKPQPVPTQEVDDSLKKPQSLPTLDDAPPTTLPSGSKRKQNESTYLRMLPRQTGTEENELIKQLISSEKCYMERMAALEEREKRAEERENRVAESMCNFFDTFTQLIQNQNSMPAEFYGMPSPSFSPPTPRTTSPPVLVRAPSPKLKRNA